MAADVTVWSRQKRTEKQEVRLRPRRAQLQKYISVETHLSCGTDLTGHFKVFGTPPNRVAVSTKCRIRAACSHNVITCRILSWHVDPRLISWRMRFRRPPAFVHPSDPSMRKATCALSATQCLTWHMDTGRLRKLEQAEAATFLALTPCPLST